MPLSSSLVGTRVESIASEIDERWTMAFAAGIGDSSPRYFDTRRADGIVAHPMFPVCFEWPAATSIRHRSRASLSQKEAFRGVHATHHTIIHRLIHPSECITTRAELIGVERRKPGAYEVARFETTDEKGSPLCTTFYGSLYRDVEVYGPDCPAPTPTIPPARAESSEPRNQLPLAIGASAAHIYTECARIWNPIHTDSAVAAAAGLPGLILHGTATLAMAVSRIVETEAAGDPERIAQIYARFGAMVLMPSEVMVRILLREQTEEGDRVYFEALNSEGKRAIRDGVVVLSN